MKRIYLLCASVVFLSSLTYAGGIVTNTNQSCSYVRMPSRNASTDIDAVYFNPAGLFKLGDGFHFLLSGQTIFQKREVDNYYKGPGDAYGLNNPVYKGDVFAPIFPDFYAVYKKNKLAFSFGIMPIGGGGTATFKKGLPSFEMAASDLVPSLASMGAQGYRLDAYFKGGSTILGYQVGAAYKFNDMLSVSLAVRYVTAKNTYQGHLNDIEVNMGGTWTRADVIMTGIAGQLSTTAGQLQPIIDGGGGTLTLAQAQGFGIIDANTRAQLEGGLASLGITDPSTLNITSVQQVYNGGAAKYTGTATLLNNQEVDVEQTGSGICPIIGLNFSPNEKWNIGIKYEFKTRIELQNKTTKDFTTGFDTNGLPITMFPNGQKFRNDMPALLTLGISYAISPKLKAAFSGNLYFDRSADYGHKINDVPVSNSDIIDHNFYELACGLEYNINNKLLVSAGYIFSKTGVNEKYLSDIENNQTSNLIGFGGAYAISKKLKIEIGAAFCFYNNNEKTVDHTFAADGSVIPARETYAKNSTMIALGLNISL